RHDPIRRAAGREGVWGTRPLGPTGEDPPGRSSRRPLATPGGSGTFEESGAWRGDRSPTSRARPAARIRPMPYTPLIHPDDIGSQANPFARSPAINDLLSRCYGSDILPARGKHLRFRRTEIFGDLYLSERTWVDEVDFATPDGSDRHEG